MHPLLQLLNHPNHTSLSDFNSISQPPCPHFPQLIIWLNKNILSRVPKAAKMSGYGARSSPARSFRGGCVSLIRPTLSPASRSIRLLVSADHFCQSLNAIAPEKLVALTAVIIMALWELKWILIGWDRNLCCRPLFCFLFFPFRMCACLIACLYIIVGLFCLM